MQINEAELNSIVKAVIAKLEGGAQTEQADGIFDDMNDAIAAAKESQKVLQRMPMDFREKIISNIRKLTMENAETLARMGVEETGMGNVGDKILKHQLLAQKTPGTEDIKTEAWSGDRGLTLIEMGPFGVIGAITPSTNPSGNHPLQLHRHDRGRQYRGVQPPSRGHQGFQLRGGPGEQGLPDGGRPESGGGHGEKAHHGHQ